MTKLIFALAAVSLVAVAQDDAAYQKIMKEVGRESGAIRKADPKTGPDVAASAEKLAVDFDQSKTYWTQRGGGDDAVKWSEDGKAAALELAAAAKAGDAAKAGSALGKVSGTCKACHDAHREKTADGAYKVK